jgi:hypothetical protein
MIEKWPYISYMCRNAPPAIIPQKMYIMPRCLNTNTKKINTQRKVRKEILQVAVNQMLSSSSASYLYTSFIPT